MTTVSLRLDDEMKKQLDEMCDEMGMNLTIFLHRFQYGAVKESKPTGQKRAGNHKNNGRTGGWSSV